jgi:hypothetical protein
MSTQDYGVSAQLVAVAGSLAAAAAAISLAWMKRTKWQPPETTLPQASSRMASLIAMVCIAILYVFASRIGIVYLALVTVVFLLIGIVALVITIGTNVKYSFYFPLPQQESNRILGGSTLTPEAQRIANEHGQVPQQMLEDAHGRKDLIWTRESQALVAQKSVAGYIALIGFGTCSLAAAAMLVSVAIGPK